MLHHVTVTLEHHNKWSEQKPSFKARKRMMCTKGRMANPAKKKRTTDFGRNRPKSGGVFQCIQVETNKF